MTFTPLVSPAVTPIDPNLQLPEYTVPGEYFSPLTSPAIEAQRVSSRRKLNHHISAPTSGSIISPLESQGDNTSLPQSARISTRRESRKAPVSGKPHSRAVRQSPLMKPQGRRKQNSLTISPAGLAELAEQSESLAPLANHSLNHQGPPITSDGSGHESISPEPLPDTLMPPPSLPRPAARSPEIAATSKSSGINEAATPSTLMKIHNQKTSPNLGTPTPPEATAGTNPMMEEIMLPESAATNGLRLSTIDSSMAALDDQGTPTLSAETPRVSAGATPRISSTSLKLKSPTGLAPLRAESRSGSTSKGRQGGTNSQVSPAIMPKISPSIMPLAPLSSKPAR
jgi:hypothetical protein